MSDVSVVVSAYDERRWDTLVSCVGSVMGQSRPPREVIIVVDHNPVLYARARERLHDAKVVANAESRGLRGVRNTGVQTAAGEIVAFIDDDALATPRWLELLTTPYERTNVAGVGGSATPMWPDRRPAWFPPEFDWVVGCTYNGMPTDRTAVRNLFGCNMSFRRELVEEVGLFRIGYSCDETELCIRIGQRWPDKEIVYVPQATVQHVVSSDRTRFRRFVSRCYYEGGSKAVVSRLVGKGDALSSERAYTRSVLPRAIRRELGYAWGGDVSAMARIGTITAGVASAGVGYAVAQLAPARAAARRGWAGSSFP